MDESTPVPIEPFIFPNDHLGRPLLIPKPPTLKKWGITELEYWGMARKGCNACGRFGVTRALAVDHEHKKGFKKFSADERRATIRGVLCFVCNGMRMVRGSTPEIMRALADYLENPPAYRVLDPGDRCRFGHHISVKTLLCEYSHAPNPTS